jgi:hypothetical protein
MSATAFLLGQAPDATWSLSFTGTPIEARREFKRLHVDPSHGLVDVRYFDTYGHAKRKTFRRNRIAADIVSTFEDAVELSDEYTGDDEAVAVAPAKTKHRTNRRN